MKHITIVISFSVLVISCHEDSARHEALDNSSAETVITIPKVSVEKSYLEYRNGVSMWLLDGAPYSGIAVSYHGGDTLKQEMRVFNGKRENLTSEWFRNGELKLIANYHEGKLHGFKKVWSSESVLLAHLNYENGKPHGEQQTWYPTGELHKKLNLNQGKEEGKQKAYRKNGALYANYEVKNGRIFGLKKAMLCFGLESENLQYEE